MAGLEEDDDPEAAATAFRELARLRHPTFFRSSSTCISGSLHHTHAAHAQEELHLAHPQPLHSDLWPEAYAYVGYLGLPPMVAHSNLWPCVGCMCFYGCLGV
ncbi:hypothetical protein EJB05_40558, partial [Eragrostis curvula]